MGHTGGVQGHHAAPGGVMVLCSAGPHACLAHASSLASGTEVPHTSVWPVTSNHSIQLTFFGGLELGGILGTTFRKVPSVFARDFAFDQFVDLLNFS